MQITSSPLVKKVHASGYKPRQNKVGMKTLPKFTKDQKLNTADTKKGDSRAFVARDSMPVSIEPIKSPRSKTLAQLGRSIKRV